MTMNESLKAKVVRILAGRELRRENPDYIPVEINSEEEYLAEYERFMQPTEDIDEAHVVTSRNKRKDWGGEYLHMPVLDIDIPHHYFPSSTDGHGHLYINLPMTEKKYFKLLDALAEAGIIEHGYADVSKRKGFSAVRLPWVKK